MRVARNAKDTPPCRVLPGFEPAIAGGIRPLVSALAAAYRVLQLIQDPFVQVLAQNVVLHHAHSRAMAYIPRSLEFGNANG